MNITKTYGVLDLGTKKLRFYIEDAHSKLVVIDYEGKVKFSHYMSHPTNYYIDGLSRKTKYHFIVSKEKSFFLV